MPERKAWSVVDLLREKAAPQLRDQLNRRFAARPGLSGVPDAVRVRLCPEAEPQIAGLRIRLPEPKPAPLRIDPERIRAARPVFTPFGLENSPYAPEARAFSLADSPAPMTAEMEITLDLCLEAETAGSDAAERFFRRLVLPARLDPAAGELRLGTPMQAELAAARPGDPASFSRDTADRGASAGDPYRIELDEYLLPLRWDAAGNDALAERMLLEFMPECLKYALPLDPYELLRRMGLTLGWKLLTRDFSVLGEIFDVDSRVEILEVHSRLPNPDYFVGAGTVLLDDRLRSGAHYPTEVLYSTLIHECVHWYKDRMHIALQRLFSPRAHLSVCRNSPAARRSALFEREAEPALDITLPADRMEAQAQALPPHLLINGSSGRRKAAEILARHGGGRTEAEYRAAVEELREGFGVTRYAAGRRLREFGCLPPPDAQARRRFTYLPAPNPDTVYDISLPRLLQLMDETRYPDFCAALRSGHYLHAEQRICLNDTRYIRPDETGVPRLTEHARRHPEECCWPFRPEVPRDPDLRGGPMAAYRHKADPVFRIPEKDINLPEEKKKLEDQIALLDRLEKMPLGLEMDYHRIHSDKTFQQWSDASYNPIGTLKGLCENPIRNMPKYRTFLRAVLGLQMIPFYSEPLMKKARLEPLRTEKEERLVALMLQLYYTYPILHIHKVFVLEGFQLIEENILARNGLNKWGEVVAKP